MFHKDEKTITSNDSKASDTSYIHTMENDLLIASGKAPAQQSSATTPFQPQETTNQSNTPQSDVQAQQAPPSVKSDSPFFANEQTETQVASNAQATNNSSAEKSQPTVFQKPIEEEYEAESKLTKSPSTVNWYKIGIISITTVIILILVGGGYFYIMTQNNQIVETPSPLPTPTENNQPVTPEEETPAVTINPESEKYSIDNPNYLSIDFENTNPEDIKNKIKSITETISTLSLQSPLEFIITDKNNNPVAFPIFAMNANIKMPASLLKSLDEKFSLYFFNDNNKTRLGLAVQAKDKNVVLTEMLNEEKNLITDLSPLFVSQSPEITNNMFKDGKYYIFSVRYQNLTNDESLSIDYTVTDSQLVIGTSKTTLRSILDKISAAKSTQSNGTIQKENNLETSVETTPTVTQ